MATHNTIKASMKSAASGNFSPHPAKMIRKRRPSLKLAPTVRNDVSECDDSYSSRSKFKKKKREKLKATTQRHDARSGYVFVVKVKDGDQGMVWNFVDFSYGTTLRNSSTITALLPRVTPEMQEVWKRIAIDDVFSWDNSSVDPKTLRLVRVTLGCEDATVDLFADEGDMREKIKLSVLSRLTSEEAKMLKVDKKHTVLQLMRDTTLDQRDVEIADRIREDMSSDMVEQVFKMNV